MTVKHLCNSCPSWDADGCAVLRKPYGHDEDLRVDEESCSCSCHDELFEEDYDEQYEQCSCRFCYCMNSVKDGGECVDCRVGAHQGWLHPTQSKSPARRSPRSSKRPPKSSPTWTTRKCTAGA